MKGLLLKDFLLMKKQMLSMLLSLFMMYGLLILVVLSIYYGNFKIALNEFSMDSILLFMCGFMGILSGFFVGSFTLTYEEDTMADFFKVSCMIPVDNRGRILAKYILFAGYIGIHLLTHLIMLPVLYAVAKLPLNTLSFLTILTLMSISILLLLIELPLLYRLGKKGRQIINTGGILLLFPVFFWFQDHILESNLPLSVVTETLCHGITITGALFPFIVIIGFPISGYFSWRVMENRRNVLW